MTLFRASYAIFLLVALAIPFIQRRRVKQGHGKHKSARKHKHKD